MKKIFVFVILAFLHQASSLAQTNTDNIFCLGNGLMAVYEAKCDIIQLFGPPYSSPSVLTMKIDDASLVIKSEREKGSAIWKHAISKDGKIIGTVTDFVDSDLACFIRKFDLSQTVTFSLKFNSKLRIIKNTASFKKTDLNDALLLESPRGIAFYNDYPMPFKQYFQIAGKKSVQIIEKEEKDTYRIECKEGEGFLYINGGPLYPECVSNTQAMDSIKYEELLSRTRSWWQKFTSRRFNFEEILSEKVPDREKLLKTIDDVAVNIKTQQATEGAVLAGHNYHLGYVRDQYGVSRCLLKLGYYKEAHDILDFYWRIWQAKGTLHNAQGIGIDAFHIHENDEVEITGYLIIQAIDYTEQSKDKNFINKIFPMLEWAWNCQKRNLVKNMLPFNGDETYVAGGILPRSALIDGSAESTLLFITSGAKLIQWAEKSRVWNEQNLNENRKILEQTKAGFRTNFFENDHLYANNPTRSTGLKLPQFRHGVCESLQDGCEFFGWTQRNDNNRYLCPVCFTKYNIPKAEPKRYLIQSVSLVPLYIGSDMFTEKEISLMVNEITDHYRTTGTLPSRPDGKITVGYDYGLLLYNLTLLNNRLKVDIYEKMLSVLDETGSWVEYYKDNVQSGTRYRPWESAINLEAAVLFAEKYK
jgi:hypothetical protein